LLNNPWPRWRLVDNCCGSVRERNEVQKEERVRKWITKAREPFRNARPAGNIIKENITRTRGLVLYARSRDTSASSAQIKIRNQQKMTRRRIR
jgi:hypothetical protein